MNHKQKQQKIIKPFNIFKEYLDTHKNSLITRDLISDCKQQAKEHKQEVLKGCGKINCTKGIRHPSIGYKCIKISNSLFNYCKDCEEVLNGYTEIGIK